MAQHASGVVLLSTAVLLFHKLHGWLLILCFVVLDLRPQTLDNGQLERRFLISTALLPATTITTTASSNY